MPDDSDDKEGNAGAVIDPGEPPTPPVAVAPPPTPEEQVKQLEQQNRELHDRLLRTAAEFENWKKRAKKESEEAAARGREALLREVLGTLDNLERALQHAAEGDPLAKGVGLVEKQLLAALEKFGVTRFDPTGQPFDPSFHDAIQQLETDQHPPGTVAQVFSRGYMSGSRLLRPAMVAVAKPTAARPVEPAEGEAQEPSEGT